MSNLLFHTTLMVTILTLTTPLLRPRYASPTTITNMTKLATTLSLIPTMIFVNSGTTSMTTNLTWLCLGLNLHIGLSFDLFTTLFLPTALLITWSILEFTNWYMASDPNKMKFSKYLLLFLMAMLMLTTASNMFQLFIGWEGVGIMSFLLIGWWHARTSATTSALQAIIYNRIGDIGLILTMAWLAMNLNTWEISLMTTHTTPTLPLLGLILAATGKSAQFGLHPWLPAAMEGPTPVSALLHSSTMVVAGIFLLIRLHPLLQTNAGALSTCLCLGALTTTFAALCALTQNDIKKIIAFSTSSQLGLMMLTLGMNQPEMAFLHIITHAFFKAMLFLCSGSIIHSLNDEQDIRKMGGLQKTLPITTACMTLGSLALTGTPFLAGFYTKDTIIETLNTSSLNAWALCLTLFATGLTAAYSLRLIFFTQLHSPRHTPTTHLTETSPHQTRPLMRLATGSIMMGLLITSMTTPMKPQTLTMAPLTKLAALTTTALGLMVALDLALKTKTLMQQYSNTAYITLAQLYFFNTATHRLMPNVGMTSAQTTSLQLMDQTWYETAAPIATKTMNTALANKLSTTHTGLVKTYLMILLTTAALTLAWQTLRHT